MPILISEGFRNVFSVDTTERRYLMMDVFGTDVLVEVVGMMAKAGQSGFTARKVVDSAALWGHTVQTTEHHYKILTEELK